MCVLKIVIDLFDQYISPFLWELMEKQSTHPNELIVHLLDLCQMEKE